MIRSTKHAALFIGNAMDARDLKLLYENDISAVVDLAFNEKPAQPARDMIYCRFPLNDGGGNTDSIIQTAISTTVSLINENQRTLVACSAGMSRAPSIASAALAIATSRDADECLAEIAADGPHDVSPVLWADIKGACGIIG